MRMVALFLSLTFAVSPLAARDSLGVFGQWGAFRDPGLGRCYAIAIPQKSRTAREVSPFATVGTWPGRRVRGQFHVRLSRKLAAEPALSLSVGGEPFKLVGGGSDAWAEDKARDAAIVAAMRSARSLTVGARDTRGRRFYDTYVLEGAATAMDAASVGCARIRR